MDPRLTALKIAYKGELHRVRVDLSAFQYEDLARLFSDTFSLDPTTFVVQYTDAEGDVLNVTSQAEYIEACRVFLASTEATKSLRFSAVSRTRVVFQENVADPILKALEKLVETLTAALNKVKQEEWAQRAQQGMAQTTEALQHAAQVGVAHTNQVLNRAAQRAQEGMDATGVLLNRAAVRAQEGMEQTSVRLNHAAQVGIVQTNEVLSRAAQRAQDGMDATGDFLNRAAQRMEEGVEQTSVALNHARQSLQEMDRQTLLQETGEGLKAAAETINSFAHEVVEEIKKLHVPTPSDATQADFEWEHVEEQAPEPAQVQSTPLPVVPEVVEVEVAAPSAEEIKWAAELSKVRDIFPDVDTQRVIDNLEHCNGNVNVVLNSLMEEM